MKYIVLGMLISIIYCTADELVKVKSFIDDTSFIVELIVIIVCSILATITIKSKVS